MTTHKHDRQQILDSYARLRHAKLVADDLGIHPSVVHYHLKKAGVFFRQGAVSACHKNHDLVVKMAAEGHSLKAIGLAIGTQGKNVRSYAMRWGIPYQRWSSGGPRNASWKGGRHADKDGYFELYMPDHPRCTKHGYYREHRYVMEQKLGRLLERHEVVDHIDGNPSNNHPDNLRLFASNAEHLRATLTGVPCPARSNRYGSSPRGKGTDGLPLLGKTRQRRVSLDRAARLLLETEPRSSPDQ